MIEKIKINIKNIFKESFVNFPLTNICLFIVTFSFVFLEDLNCYEDILMLFGTFLLGCFCIETKKVNKFNYIVSFVISFIFWILLKNDFNYLIENFVKKFYATYIFVLLTYVIYCNYKNSKQEFSEYLENIFRAFFKLSFTYGLLALCIFMICYLFNELVIEIFNDEMILDVEIFLLGMYYFSNILCIIRGNNSNEGVFFKKLHKNILCPLLYVAVMIIYLFIIRLFIDGNIDEDYIFYIVANLFLIGVPIILMCNSYKENMFIDKINNYSSYLLIPFVLLQLYLLFNKINLSGICDDSYLWIMIIIFELFYLYYSFKKIDYGNLFKVLMIMIIIYFVFPFVNLEDLVNYSQFKNLELYKIKSEYTDVEKERIYNAYVYFNRYNNRNKNYFDKLGINDDDKKIINCFSSENCIVDNDYNNNYDNIYVYNNLNSLDINGYDKLYKFNIYKYNLNDKYINWLQIKYDDKILDVYFREYFDKYYKNKDNIINYFKDNNIILVGDEYKIILSKYDVGLKNDNVTSYEVDGYLLVRETNKDNNLSE